MGWVVRLAGELVFRLSEAVDYIKRYFERLPGVRAYVEQTLKNARACGVRYDHVRP